MSVDGAAEKSSLQKSRSELQLSHSLRQINFFDPCKAEISTAYSEIAGNKYVARSNRSSLFDLHDLRLPKKLNS